MQETIDKLAGYNRLLRQKTPKEIVDWALSVACRPILTTNFGPYSASLIHLVNQSKKDISVIWCDTGFNTSFTHQFADKITNQLELRVFTYFPKSSSKSNEFIMAGVPQFDDQKHKEFTEHVKLEPFSRALSEHRPDVWFSNLRKGQTKFRDELDILSFSKSGILKVSPFHYWTDDELSNYLNENGLDNETRYYDPTKITLKNECGLHVQ